MLGEIKMPFDVSQFKSENEGNFTEIYDLSIPIENRIAGLERLHAGFKRSWDRYERNMLIELTDSPSSSDLKFDFDSKDEEPLSPWSEVESIEESHSPPSSDAVLINRPCTQPKFQAIESILLTIAEDEKLDSQFVGEVYAFIAKCATDNFPQKSVTPLDDPHMEKAIFYFEKILKTTSFNDELKSFACNWLVCLYLRRMPAEADMNHVYAVKAIEYADILLKDKLVRPQLKVDVAGHIAQRYESLVKDEFDESENSLKSKVYQTYVVEAFTAGERFNKIAKFVRRSRPISYLLKDRVENEDDENISEICDLANKGKISEALQKIKIISPDFDKESEQDSKQLESPKSKYAGKMTTLGFWKTNIFAFDKMKKELMSEKPSLFMNPTLENLLSAAIQKFPPAIKALEELIAYHYGRALSYIPKMVAAFQSERINQKEFETQITRYQYGNGYIPLSSSYEGLGCDHLRELDYLWNHDHKNLLKDFYNTLEQACIAAGIITNTFNDFAKRRYSRCQSNLEMSPF
jgi:hypothetical protein